MKKYFLPRTKRTLRTCCSVFSFLFVPVCAGSWLKPSFFCGFFLFLFCLPSLYAQYNTDPEIPIWRQALGGAVIGNPIAQVESVVVATDGGNLKSFSSQGRQLWNYYAGGRLAPFVSRSWDGTSYICRTNGRLMAINRSGRELWNINLGSPLIFRVLIGWDGRLFVFTERKITCITASGYILWSRMFEERIAIAPVIDSTGGVIFVAEGGQLLSLDPFGNIYSYSTEKPPVALASIELEGRGPTVLLLHEDRGMELVYTSLKYGIIVDGRIDLPSPPLAAVGRKDEAAVLLKDGKLALISPEKRIVLWTGVTHIRSGELSNAAGLAGEEVKLLFDERGIYVLTKTGATGFAHDGRRLWTMSLRGASSVPSFGDDGILYSGGNDWILYAYRLENRARAEERLIYGEASPGNYGTGIPGYYSRTDHRFGEVEILQRFTEIRAAIRGGYVGTSEKEYAAWLMGVAGSVVSNPNAGNHLLVHSHHRLEAARLLAYVGSRETIPFLADLFSRDPDTLVKAAAAEAIGKIGVDPEGYALRAFESAITPPLRNMDERTLTAVAAATGALCRFSGPPVSQVGIRILARISGNNMFPIASRQAQEEIGSLF